MYRRFIYPRLLAFAPLFLLPTHALANMNGAHGMFDDVIPYLVGYVVVVSLITLFNVAFRKVWILVINILLFLPPAFVAVIVALDDAKAGILSILYLALHIWLMWLSQRKQRVSNTRTNETSETA